MDIRPVSKKRCLLPNACSENLWRSSSRISEFCMHFQFTIVLTFFRDILAVAISRALACCWILDHELRDCMSLIMSMATSLSSAAGLSQIVTVAAFWCHLWICQYMFDSQCRLHQSEDISTSSGGVLDARIDGNFLAPLNMLIQQDLILCTGKPAPCI